MPEPRRPTLAVALLSVALSWVPFLGFCTGLVALAFGIRDRRRGLPGALVVSALGLTLSTGFSAAFVACAPSGASPAARPTWEAFERLFQPDGGPPGSQSQQNPEDAGRPGKPGP